VLVAVAILAMFLVPMLSAIINGLKTVERARNMQIARELALDKLEELEITKIPEMEGEFEGDFSPTYPLYKWHVVFSKNPDLQLLETQIAGLQTMEVELTVFWPEGEATRELTFRSLLAQ